MSQDPLPPTPSRRPPEASGESNCGREETSPTRRLPPESCGCGSAECESGLNRRAFLKLTGVGAAALCLADPSFLFAAEKAGLAIAPQHLIPREKDLPLGWLRGLTEKGGPDIWRGTELVTIGMPVGGIGTGQLYLCGDGTLGNWEIFNRFDNWSFGETRYGPASIKRPVDQGFALVVRRGDRSAIHSLSAQGFADVAFRGEYPIGRVTYSDSEIPVEAELEAFSPFIPLNAGDSALPATLFHITVKNVSKERIEVQWMGWLENPIAALAGEKGRRGHRVTRIEAGTGDARLLHGAVSDVAPSDSNQPPRDPVILADFEGDTYGDWEVEGKAFGTGPSHGTFPHQQTVAGFEGNGLVNSFVGGDAPQGLLRSPAFTISRRYLNFLIGGGAKPGVVGMRLLVDGRTVRSTTGVDSEKLRWDFWDVAELEGKEARLELYDRSSDSWGHILVDQIELADRPRGSETTPETLEKYSDYGTLGLACDAECLGEEETDKQLAEFPEYAARFLAKSGLPYSLSEKRSGGLLTRPIRLKPGEAKTVLFVLAWHFPNTVRPEGYKGHEYAARFADGAAVLDYVVANRTRLVDLTRRWHDTYYDSTLPVWLLNRLHWTVSCLATGTAQWWRDGRFWAWEGVQCCAGTCTHVYNYAQSMARVFPELERNVRERQDFGAAFNDETGLVGFRGDRNYAADGQCGTILKAWREHLMSADGAFLERNWPCIKKAIGYLLEQDDNDDGLIENSQHNTYDINFEGANTFVGGLYLGALRAGEEMARERGETEFADRLHDVFEKGSKLSVERLWKGEFFVQDVDLEKYPKFQYGPGCLSDQMFGQSWAHQVGLGYLYPEDKVKTALKSVWAYNWAPDVGPYQRRVGPERPFAEPGEAGLFLCTWPKSPYLRDGVLYKNEVWTGIEYQVASHMIREGMVQEGLAICRAVHDRYQPSKRNPYNEVECGDFYARAMASWAVLLALEGFEYHGPRGRIGFAPGLNPERFRAPFTAAEGWGTYEQTVQGRKMIASITIRWGLLRLRSVALEIPGGAAAASSTARLGDRTLAAKPSVVGKRLVMEFPEDVVVGEGERLEIRVG